MLNIGEEIVAAYLEYILECDFIQKNLYTKEVQGEIDVVGVNLKTNKVYICESTVHLITGFRYTKDGKPNSTNKLIDKYKKDIQYAEKYLDKYERHYMFWSPIVKTTPNPVYDQMHHIKSTDKFIKENYKIEIDWVINETYGEKLMELRKFAGKQTKNIQSPILRYLQIEEYLKKHNVRTLEQVNI